MKVVVLHSGGLDSTALLATLLAEGHDCLALGVAYGQRHARELEAARAVCERLGVERVEADLSAGLAGLLTGSALTDPSVPLPEGHYAEESMRATVVPNRNMILLAVAGAVASARGCDAVAYAAHDGDHAIYPDCRLEFGNAMGDALALCDWRPLRLLRPFIGTDKAGVVKAGARHGAPLDLTWSCYAGGERHCGRCGTCVERREAFALAGVTDPTEYEP
jgi:7-cyano-7-deazaguanine synthase